MRNFYYVHTGHRVGLDRFRRACAIIKSLGDIDITLLCSDFRIANEARHYGVEKAVGIDDVRNISKIANHGDNLIYDSDEANPIMLEDMREYFSKFIRVSDRLDDIKAPNEFLISPYLEGDGICQAIAVDKDFFGEFKKSNKIGFFYGDDDYEKDIEKNLECLEELDPAFGLGFYFFLDYEDMLKKRFKNHYEFDEYKDFIKSCEILISSSPQAVLECLASGGKPIYFQREDYRDDFVPFFEKIGVDIVKECQKNSIERALENAKDKKLQKTVKNSNTIVTFIKDILD